LEDNWETQLFTNSLGSTPKKKALCNIYDSSVLANPKLPENVKEYDQERNTFFCHPFHDIMF